MSKFPKFFKALKQVAEGEASILYTDEDLRVLTNHALPKKDRVALSTWEFWKSPTISAQSLESQKNIDQEEVEEFREFMDSLRSVQKRNIGEKLLSADAEKSSKYYMWQIMQLKFKDLTPTPQVQLNHSPTIMIQAGDKESQSLIDKIVNSTIDIDHEEVVDTKKLK